MKNYNRIIEVEPKNDHYWADYIFPTLSSLTFSQTKLFTPSCQEKKIKLENMKFLGHCWKYRRAYLTLGIYSLIDFYRNKNQGKSVDLQCNLVEGWGNIQFEVIQYTINHVGLVFQPMRSTDVLRIKLFLQYYIFLYFT